MKKELENKIAMILDYALTVIMIALFILMFTGRTGAIISACSFMSLLIICNIKLPKKTSKAGQWKKAWKSPKHEMPAGKNTRKAA